MSGPNFECGLFFGVMEPESWVKTRRTRIEEYTYNGCTTCDDERDTSYCGVCGSKTEEVTRHHKVEVGAEEAYKPAHLVHVRSHYFDDDEPCILGFEVGGVDVSFAEISRCNAPTPEEVESLREWLTSMEYDGPEPMMWLVSDAS